MTGLSLPAIFALAVKVIDQIPAHSSVPTGVQAAVVNVWFGKKHCFSAKYAFTIALQIPNN